VQEQRILRNITNRNRPAGYAGFLFLFDDLTERRKVQFLIIFSHGTFKFNTPNQSYRHEEETVKIF
jgi:hypothetical protein